VKDGFFRRIKSFLFRQRSSERARPIANASKVEETSLKEELKHPQLMAYSLIGDKMSMVLPLFKDLDIKLRRAGLKINLKVYVSLTIFATMLACISALVVIPCLLLVVFNLPLIPSIMFGVGGSLLTCVSSILSFYIYPIYRADVLRRAIEDELPFTTGYMAILANAGVPPERIFSSLSNLSLPSALRAESNEVMMNVNLFGSDMISALEETSERTPSQRFREMIEGLITTIHSGSNLSIYLREKSLEFMRLKRISLKKYADTLSMLSEIYVSILLTGPLFLVIMLTVMSMLGGGDFGIFSPDLLLELLTYVAIPIGAIAFLVILDTTSPKR
jgi:flagellar protein FlaJ